MKSDNFTFSFIIFLVYVRYSIQQIPSCGGYQSSSCTGIYQSGPGTLTMTWSPNCNGQIWKQEQVPPFYEDWYADGAVSPFNITGQPVGSTNSWWLKGADWVCESAIVTISEWPLNVPSTGSSGPSSSSIFPVSTPTSSDDCFIENSVDYFIYLGSVQTYTVPPCVFTLVVQTYGAQGGRYEQPGGLGGFIQGSIAVEPTGVLYVYVGQAGYSAGYCNYASGVFNGGGGGNCGGGTGGGASDIRTVQGDLTTRLIVAGGGGGGAYGGGGGCGGGLEACSSRGGGGTQTEGTSYPGYLYLYMI